MNWAVRALPFIALALPAAVHAEQRPTLVTIWKVQPPIEAVGTEKIVGDGELVLRQKLLPTGLATLDADVADPGGRLIVKAGTQLVRAMTETGRAYCALATLRANKKTGELAEDRTGQTLCLIDADSNGRFESVVEMSGGIGLLMVNGRLPKKLGTADASYSETPVNVIKGDFWVGLRYEQYFNIYGNRMFFTDYGGRGEKQSLSDFAKFKANGSFPQALDISGAKLTVIATEPKGARIRIDAPWPEKTFAVFSYTTTTLIPIYH